MSLVRVGKSFCIFLLIVAAAHIYGVYGVLLAALFVLAIALGNWAFPNKYEPFGEIHKPQPIVIHKVIGGCRLTITVEVKYTRVPDNHCDEDVWQGILNSFIPKTNEGIKEGVTSTFKKYTDIQVWSNINVEVDAAYT